MLWVNEWMNKKFQVIKIHRNRDCCIHWVHSSSALCYRWQLMASCALYLTQLLGQTCYPEVIKNEVNHATDNHSCCPDSLISWDHTGPAAAASHPVIVAVWYGITELSEFKKNCNLGLVQKRSLVSTPPPHDLEHLDHGDHTFHWPLTTFGRQPTFMQEPW